MGALRKTLVGFALALLVLGCSKPASSSKGAAGAVVVHDFGVVVGRRTVAAELTLPRSMDAAMLRTSCSCVRAHVSGRTLTIELELGSIQGPIRQSVMLYDGAQFIVRLRGESIPRRFSRIDHHRSDAVAEVGVFSPVPDKRIGVLRAHNCLVRNVRHDNCAVASRAVFTVVAKDRNVPAHLEFDTGSDGEHDPLHVVVSWPARNRPVFLPSNYVDASGASGKRSREFRIEGDSVDLKFSVTGNRRAQTDWNSKSRLLHVEWSGDYRGAFLVVNAVDRDGSNGTALISIAP